MAINEKQKWPTDKPRYDKNYLRLYGKPCPVCTGRQEVLACWKCGGIGYEVANSDNSEKKK